jgi:hypothetical protein
MKQIGYFDLGDTGKSPAVAAAVFHDEFLRGIEVGDGHDEG